MIFLTSPGKTYSVNSVGGCTISAGGTTLATIPANVQTTFIAPEEEVIVSDDNAIIVEVTGVGAGGSGEGGMTEEERTLLTGAAQRDADNTFSAANTFTGTVDMSTASVTPPSGWNVGELTAEAIQAVAPMAWGTWTTPPSCNASGGIAIGQSAIVTNNGNIAIGEYSHAYTRGTVIGDHAYANGELTSSFGRSARAYGPYSITIGAASKTEETGIAAISVGTQFTEAVNGQNVTRTCTTEGTGSITIGAGANTLNTTTTVDGVETTVESSNSVTIGCKASNSGADSVVVGAQAKGAGIGNVIVGAGATFLGSPKYAVAIGAEAKTGSQYSIALGCGANSGNVASISIGYNTTTNYHSDIAIGNMSIARGNRSLALGATAVASGMSSVAIGDTAKVADYGAVVFRSTAEDGTYTQLYFSGANTPLANTYEGGEAMLGYVVRDSAGNVMTDAEGNAMVGTQKLSVLFPNNRGENAFSPSTLDLDDDYTPKPMFRPSDLNLPVEEPTEEEYTPLPVYPIVEPEIEEIPSES